MLRSRTIGLKTLN